MTTLSIIQNQFYQMQGSSVETVELESIQGQSLTKISLFNNIENCRSINDDNGLDIFPTNSGNIIYFCKRVVDGLLILDCYLNDDEMTDWLDLAIKPSSFDYLIWPRGQHKAPKLMVFDMDSTFIEIEVIDELARRHGVGESVSKVTESAMRGELDFSESLISRVSCLKGLDEGVISDIARQLPLSKGVDRLVEKSADQNVKTAIVSGGFLPFVNHLKQTMGLFEVSANNLESVDGRLTGKLLGVIVDAKAKAVFVNKLIADLKLTKNDVIAIGDGANDLLMMKEAGFSLAYRAKAKVQEQAKGRMNITQLNHLACVFEW